MKLSHLRGELLRHGVNEGLTNNEIMLLWHILDLDFTSKGISWPARKTLAQKMGFKNQTSVTNMITKLDERGFVKRKERTGNTNQYDWTPMIERFKKYINQSFENEGGVHSEMKGASSKNEGGVHSEMKQISSIESHQRNSSINLDAPNGANARLSNSKIPYQEIIEYLNEKAETRFRASTPATKKLILVRWKEGFRVEDFKIVIDKKTKQWKHDPSMKEYLRPATLFSTKFEQYLNGHAGRSKIFDLSTEELDKVKLPWEKS